eukprot:COSAG04_NODE_25962_length_301_cov_0.856436_1_plen_51_part_01
MQLRAVGSDRAVACRHFWKAAHKSGIDDWRAFMGASLAQKWGVDAVAAAGQ